MMKKTASLTVIASALALSLSACGQAKETASAQPAPADNASASVSEETAAPDYATAPTGAYTLDKTHGYITFRYDHQGYSTPYLRWRDWDAILNWNAEDPALSSVSVTINTPSIDSGVDEFDGHLRSEKFFDVAQFPQITFTSTAAQMKTPTTGTLTGDLTIKGITHPVTLDVTFNKATFDARDSSAKIGFSARTTVYRSEWDLGFAVPYVSNAVDLIIETEFEAEAATE